jgi:hypothetical protein
VDHAHPTGGALELARSAAPAPARRRTALAAVARPAGEVAGLLAHQRQHGPDVVALARLRSLFLYLWSVPRLRSAAWGVSRRAPAPRWPSSPAVHLPTLA